jgi:hypothetical protein
LHSLAAPICGASSRFTPRTVSSCLRHRRHSGASKRWTRPEHANRDFRWGARRLPGALSHKVMECTMRLLSNRRNSLPNRWLPGLISACSAGPSLLESCVTLILGLPPSAFR